jgi:hypothetical protein
MIPSLNVPICSGNKVVQKNINQVLMSMTNKSIIFLMAAAFVTGLIYFLTLDSSTGNSRESPVAASRSTDNSALIAASHTATAAVPVSEPAAVEVGEEKPILGQFMRVHEVRENNDGNGDGLLRNMEFVFRQGILPQMLFPTNGQVILKYDQLARNMVGFGAATAFFYYEIVTHDTNGDGLYTDLDAITVAVSRPTGNEYLVLATNVDEVLAYEDLSEEDALRLTFRAGGEEVTHVYSLTRK